MLNLIKMHEVCMLLPHFYFPLFLFQDEQNVSEEALELENEEILEDSEDEHVSISSDEIGAWGDLQEANNGNAADVYHHLNYHYNQVGHPLQLIAFSFFNI